MPPAEVLYAENIALRQELALAKAQIALLRRQVYSSSKSEKTDRLQKLLELDSGDQVEHSEPVVEQITYERTKPTGQKRPLPAETYANLPVKETVVIEPEEVLQDPDAFEKIGEEKTFEIDIVPPQMLKREIIRPKYRRRGQKEAAPVIAPAPLRVMNGGHASAGLIAWVLIGKYLNHLPLARQERMSESWGARISRQTMVDWVRVAADWLEPIYKLMLATLLAGRYIQADETPIRCQDPDDPRGRTFLGYMWVVSRPGEDVVFVWRNSRRHGELPEVIGDNYKGILQSDAYEAYISYAKSHPEVTWLPCWVHSRRKFIEAQNDRPKPVRVMLRLIGNLYRMESDWDQANVTPDERSALRQQHFTRTLRWIHALALKLRGEVLAQSPLGKACNYLLSLWEPLKAHINHGVTKLDTNLVENSLRPCCVGKKNFMFIGHPDAGQRSAVIYSIVASCRRHGKDPFDYLRDVLTRLPRMKNSDDLSVLLPGNWQPSR